MSLPSSVRSLSGGIITLLVALTLLATQQQPLLASQVDDTRHSGPFVSLLSQDSDADHLWSIEDQEKRSGEMEHAMKVCNSQANTSECEKMWPLPRAQPNNTESRCKTLYSQLECKREAACRLCNKTVAEAVMQDNVAEISQNNDIKDCSVFGLALKIDCSTVDARSLTGESSTATATCIAIGVIVLLGLAGTAAFMMCRRSGSRKTGSRLGGNKSAIQTGTGATSKKSSKVGSKIGSKIGSKSGTKSATKSAKVGSSTGGSSGTTTPSGPAKAV